MAKAKKRGNNNALASKPASRVAPATSTAKQQEVVAVEQHAECHVNVAVSPAKGATDAVELKLTFSEEAEQAASAAAAQDMPAAAATAAALTPAPTEPTAPPTPVVVASSNASNVKAPAAEAKPPAAAARTATAAVVKSHFLPPGVVSNLGRYFELAVQAYTYPAYYAAGATVGVASAVATEVTRHVPTLFKKTAA